MKSFLLQELTRLILPFSILLGVALLLKGHNAPGGGFVAGLSVAVAAVLELVAFGQRRFNEVVPVEPERVALIGGLFLVVSIVWPLALGRDALTHLHGQVAGGPLSFEWQSAMVFEIGVVMVVGGGLSAAALWLWGGAGPAAGEE